VPGGSGEGIPGKGGCAGLAFWRFFSGRGLAIRSHAILTRGHPLGGTLCGGCALARGVSVADNALLVNLACVSGDVQVKNVLSAVVPMLLAIFALPSPAGTDMTIYFAPAVVEVPARDQLLMLGSALIGVGGLVRKWRQSRRGAGLDHSS
jgi:hypothetical protein